jgi:hypothetical protein
VNDWGRPFTDGSFGNKFRDWCDQAELDHCSVHGLRKGSATIAANNGGHRTSTHGYLRLGYDQRSREALGQYCQIYGLYVELGALWT